MPVTIDAVNTPSAATGTTASLTTVSFSPPVGETIVLLWGANHPTPTVDVSISSVTNTGTAVIWTRRARKNQNAASDGGVGTAGGAEIWTGVAPGGAITVTANGVASGAGTEKSLAPVVLAGADTAALSNISAAFSASGLPSVTVTGCAAGSYVLAVSSDWQALGAGTAGSGQTIINEFHTASQMTMHWWRTTTTLAGAGSQTMNLTAPSGQQYNAVAIEVRAAAGTADTSAVPQPLPPPLLFELAARWQRSYADVTAAQTTADTGTAALALTGQATAVKVAVQRGAAALAVTGAGAAARRAAGSGTAAVALTGTGAARRTALTAGSALLALTGTGAETAGTARAQSGSALLALTGAGTARRTAAPSGRAVLALDGAALALHRAVGAGTAAVALSGTGAARKAATVAGRAVLAVLGTGAETAGTARAQSGVAAVALTGTGSARRRALPAGTAAVAVAGSAAALRRALTAGAAVLTIAGSGAAVRRAAASGRAVLAVQAYEVVPLPVNPPGAGFTSGADRPLIVMLGGDSLATWTSGDTRPVRWAGTSSTGGPGTGGDRPST